MKISKNIGIHFALESGLTTKVSENSKTTRCSK